MAARRATVAVLCGVQAVDVLGVTLTTTALPTILRGLGAGPSAATPIVTAYAMTFGGLLLLGARLGDRVGHRRLLLAAIALYGAASALGAWRLTGCTLVVTLEPCTMCAGALVLARVERLVFGAYDPKAGAVASLFDVLRDPRLNHRVDVRGGILEAECGQVLLDFFAGQRGAGTD